MSDKKNTHIAIDAGEYGYSIPLESFFNFALSVDCVVIGYHMDAVKVLLIKRGAEPYKGMWALPGDLMYPQENLDEAATRVLYQLTGIKDLFMEQSGSFGQLNRHPSGRVVTVSYYALVNVEDYAPVASAWAEKLCWHSLDAIPDLAFDHHSILNKALGTLKQEIYTRPIGMNMLPRKFTLNDMQTLYEMIGQKKLDKANFRKKILASDLVVPINEVKTDVRHRPAKLYKATAKKFK